MHISGLENLKRTPVILTIRRSCPPSRLPIKADKAPGLIILHRSNWVRFANPKGYLTTIGCNARSCSR